MWRKKTAQGVLWINDSRIHENMKVAGDDSAVKQACCDWCMWPSTQRIGKDINASSLLTRRAVDVISETFFRAMTGDRDDELAAMDLSMIAVAQTPSWLVCILTVMPVWLNIFHIILVFFRIFFRTWTYICYTSVSWVWFLLPYLSLQSNWAWKPSIFGPSISFCLWIFVSAHAIVT